MSQVPIVHVRWKTSRDFGLCVLAAYERQGLPRSSALLLAAHSALSTGWGGTRSGKGLRNYMLAGIKAVSEKEPYIVLKGSELIAGKYVSGMMRWRSFSTLDEGAAGVVGLLRRRYPRSLELLMAGDERYFAEVGREGWYTAPPAEVSAQMKACKARLLAWLQAGGPPPVPATETMETGAADLLVLVLLAGAGVVAGIFGG